MKPTLLFLGALLPVGAMFLACSSSSNNAPPPAAPADAAPPPPEAGTADDVKKALDARAKAYCDRLFDCCDEASQSTLLQFYAPGGNLDRDHCEEGIKTFLSLQSTESSTGVQRKTLQFFPSIEADCLKADLDKKCSEFFAKANQSAPILACADAFKGTLDEGAKCRINAVCKSGYCKTEGDTGTCATAPKEGDDCDLLTDCGKDLYCDKITAAPECKTQKGKCAARGSVALGKDCCVADECKSGGQCVHVTNDPNDPNKQICDDKTALKCSG